jgi:hypothetical protein
MIAPGAKPSHPQAVSFAWASPILIAPGDFCRADPPLLAGLGAAHVLELRQPTCFHLQKQRTFYTTSQLKVSPARS